MSVNLVHTSLAPRVRIPRTKNIRLYIVCHDSSVSKNINSAVRVRFFLILCWAKNVLEFNLYRVAAHKVVEFYESLRQIKVETPTSLRTF